MKHWLDFLGISVLTGMGVHIFVYSLFSNSVLIYYYEPNLAIYYLELGMFLFGIIIGIGLAINKATELWDNWARRRNAQDTT